MSNRTNEIRVAAVTTQLPRFRGPMTYEYYADEDPVAVAQYLFKGGPPGFEWATHQPTLNATSDTRTIRARWRPRLNAVNEPVRGIVTLRSPWRKKGFGSDDWEGGYVDVGIEYLEGEYPIQAAAFVHNGTSAMIEERPPGPNSRIVRAASRPRVDGIAYTIPLSAQPMRLAPPWAPRSDLLPVGRDFVTSGRMGWKRAGARLEVVPAPSGLLDPYGDGEEGTGRGALAVFGAFPEMTWNYELGVRIHAGSVGTFNPYRIPVDYRAFHLLLRVREFMMNSREPSFTAYVVSVETRDCADWSVRGRVRLTRVLGFYRAGDRDMGHQRVLLTTACPGVVDGENRVRARVEGPRIQVWINDVPAIDLVDEGDPDTLFERPILAGLWGVQFGMETGGVVEDMHAVALP